MKCDTCKHKKYHVGGSWYSIADGGNDPFAYEFCSKFHWCGDPINYDNIEPDNDLYEDCEDYEKL